MTPTILRFIANHPLGKGAFPESICGSSRAGHTVSGSTTGTGYGNQERTFPESICGSASPLYVSINYLSKVIDTFLNLTCRLLAQLTSSSFKEVMSLILLQACNAQMTSPANFSMEIGLECHQIISILRAPTSPM